MEEPDAFGAMLRAYRMRLDAPRRSIEWLARRLAYSTSTVYGWESGDISKGLPSRQTVLSIGRWYGLSIDEVNHLILACRAQRKRPAQAAHYVRLSSEEARGWSPIQGSMLPLIDVLQDQLSVAREAYIAGELRAARRLTASVLVRVEAREAGYAADDLLSCDERSELAHLWVQAWHGFFEASALLESTHTLKQICPPYFAHARAIRDATDDDKLAALLSHLEGDFYHLQGQHTQAMAFHYQALERLGRFDNDAALAAMIQRLIILDGAHALSQEQLGHEIHTGNDLTKSLSDGSYCARILLREAIGRVQGMTDDPACWYTLGEAEREARLRFPVGHVTTLYSRMVALTAPLRQIDRDQLRAIGGYALTTAMQHGWQRRVGQITRTAAPFDIDFPTFSS